MKKRNSPIDISKLYERITKTGADTQLSRGEAAALIASCLTGGAKTDRMTRNRIARQLDHSCLRDDDYQMGGLARLPNGKFTVDEIGRWASQHYDSELFQHLPDKPRDLPWNRVERFALQATATNDLLPGDLERCQAEVRRLREKMRQMQAASKQAVEHRKETLLSYLNREK